MATLTRGITFGASETVTNTKLHNLVDLGAVSQIVDADCSPSMALSDTKLADITTGNKVRGTALGNLASIPSGAGVIPTANMPLLGSSLVSLTSIPNASLLPITLSSWVDGVAMRNIQSMPSLAGQFAWYSVVSSLASGGFVGFSGGGTLVGRQPAGLIKSSTASPSGASSSGNISISSNKTYFIVFDFSVQSTGGQIGIRFNGDTTVGEYGYVYRGFTFAAGASNSNADFATVDNIPMSAATLASTDEHVAGYFYIFPQGTTSNKAHWVKGAINGPLSAGGRVTSDFVGAWRGSDTTTYFELIPSAGTFTGTISVYELG